MESLYLLVPFSVVLVLFIGVVFWWTLKSGQMDDLEGPGYRVLMDDDSPKPENQAEQVSPEGKTEAEKQSS